MLKQIQIIAKKIDNYKGRYKYTYNLKGDKIVDELNNCNPDEINKMLGLMESKSTNSKKPTSSKKSNDENRSSADTDGNSKVTIKEAKAAGFSMPITSNHWLYRYMQDNELLELFQ